MPIDLKLERERINFSKLKWQVLDCLFPPFCCSCGCLGNEICANCFSQIHLTSSFTTCSICGDWIHKSNICKNCSKERPVFSQLRSWGVYSGVLKDAIHRLKYERGVGIAQYFLPSLADFIFRWGIQPQLIVSVPLSKKRYRSRGYNQASLIAKPIAKRLCADYSDSAIQRIRDTQSQVGLTAEQRKSNLSNAFIAEEQIVKEKSVLIIDDISTTGTTLNECAGVFRRAGAIEIFCFTIARAFSSGVPVKCKVNI